MQFKKKKPKQTKQTAVLFLLFLLTVSLLDLTAHDEDFDAAVMMFFFFILKDNLIMWERPQQNH